MSHDVLLCCLAPSGRHTMLAATLGYAEIDPYAVRIDFHGAPDDITWLVDRELLVAGRDAPVGEGDVRIRPADRPDAIEIHFSSPYGRLETSLPRPELDLFLARTLRLVPLGEERVDADELLAALRGSQAE